MEQKNAAIEQAQKEVDELTIVKQEFAQWVAVTESILETDRAVVADLTANMRTFRTIHSDLSTTYELRLHSAKVWTETTSTELFETQKAALQKELIASEERVKRAASEKDSACQMQAELERAIKRAEKTFVENALRRTKNGDETKDLVDGLKEWLTRNHPRDRWSRCTMRNNALVAEYKEQQ